MVCHYYYYYYYYYFVVVVVVVVFVVVVSCRSPSLPGTTSEPTAIPTAQVSTFTLQYLPYYV
jgi:hypothetical protein